MEMAKNINDKSNNEIMVAMRSAPKKWHIKLIIATIIIGITVWSISGIAYKGVNAHGVTVVNNIMKFFINPDIMTSKLGYSPVFDYFFSLKTSGVPFLIYQTLMIAFLGTLLGAIISIPLAFISSRNITGNAVAFLGNALITLIRTVPVFIWGLFFVTVQGGPLAGVLAISVSSVGMISKLYIETIEDMDKGIVEALDSTGATTYHKIRFGIIPQLTASFLSIGIYRFEINVRNATLLGMVGAGGIGFTLINAMSSSNWGLVSVCLWGIIPVVIVVELFSVKVRTKLV